jgi:hypothetical protein
MRRFWRSFIIDQAHGLFQIANVVLDQVWLDLFAGSTGQQYPVQM